MRIPAAPALSLAQTGALMGWVHWQSFLSEELSQEAAASMELYDALYEITEAASQDSVR